MSEIRLSESEVAWIIHGMMKYYFDIDIRSRIRLLTRVFPALQKQLKYEQTRLPKIPSNPTLETDKKTDV